MKKLLLSTSTLALLLTGVISEAAADCNGLYLAGRGGVVEHKYSKSGSLNTDGLDSNKLMLSAALGYRYNYFRTEIEYVWRDKNENTETIGTDGKNTATFKSYSTMLNGYIDLAPYNWFTPYISAGIGLTKLKYTENFSSPAHSESHTTNGNYDPMRFTWSVGGGLSIKVTNRFNVDAGYRFYDMGSIRHADIKAHEIYGGLRYVF
jgi:opacity protein-like surface antigen